MNLPFLKVVGELKSRITDAINLTTGDTLRRVYVEFDYRSDVRRASKGLAVTFVNIVTTTKT